MKIGIIGCFYNCADLLPQVMAPWIKVKNEGYDIVLGAINAQFTEYAELGYADDDEETRMALAENAHLFESLIISNEPLREHEARSAVLKELLAQDVDLVWILDGDEVYTPEQIKNVIQFVERTLFDYYHIYFDNRVFGEKKWGDTFAPPRIFRAHRHHGIKEFVWDNDLTFNDGTHIHDCVPGMVPKKMAHVLHYTWRRHEAERKILFHKQHYGYSMYKLDEAGNLDLDLRYFLFHNMPVPERLPDGSFAPSPKQTLEVILRSHSAGNFRDSAKRVIDELGGKQELTIRSARSLVHSLLVLERANIINIRLTVLDDHSDEYVVQKLKELLSLCPFETSVMPLESHGNDMSLRTAYNRGLASGAELLYFVEDDYLHEPTALLEMVLSYRAFARNLGQQEVGLHPVDYIDRYTETITPARVVLGSHRHWRTILSTTGTFMISRITLVAQWPYFILFSENGANEEPSINQVWRNHTIMFSPIPTLAYHMHDEAVMPPFSSWKKLWDSLEM